MKIFTLATLSLIAATAHAEVIDQRSNDVSVLQAWIGESTAPSILDSYGTSSHYKLDVNNCKTLERTQHTGSQVYFYIKVDCTEELQKVAKLTTSNIPSPILNKAIFSYMEVPERSTVYPSTGSCETVEFRTIIRNSTLNSVDFKGIGFYEGGAYDGEITSIISPENLHAVGQVTLKDGSSATVHRFLAQGFCFGTGGNGGSIYSRKYKFRPFAAFAAAQAPQTLYRVWDNVEQDYLLGRKDEFNFVTTFDRQNILLK